MTKRRLLAARRRNQLRIVKPLRSYLPAAEIFCLALLVRIAYNVTVARGYVPEYDARTYSLIAYHLINEHCFCLAAHVATASRAPFWPWLIAGIYILTGQDNLHARLFLCFTGASTCTIVYLWAKDIFSRRIGIITGVIAALYPGLFIWDGWLYTESLYTFLLLTFAYCLYRLQYTARLRWAVVSGLALAAAGLTRPNGLLYLGLLFVWAVLVLRAKLLPWRTVARAVLIVTLLGLGLVAPWTVRNYRISHTFIPVATGGGTVLAGAYNNIVLRDQRVGYPGVYRGLWVSPRLIRPSINYHSCSFTCDHYDDAYVRQWIQTHPGQTLELFGLHFINMWRPYTSEEGLPVREFPHRASSRFVWDMMNITPIPVILLAFSGLLLAWRQRRQQLMIPVLLIGMDIAQCIVFYGSSRFRAPIEPILVLLVGGALWRFAQRSPKVLRSRRSRDTYPEARKHAASEKVTATGELGQA
jgi:4-amino-4-deoxy-L-arabinose transferase-like glycosyltransferase